MKEERQLRRAPTKGGHRLRRNADERGTPTKEAPIKGTLTKEGRQLRRGAPIKGTPAQRGKKVLFGTTRSQAGPSAYESSLLSSSFFLPVTLAPFSTNNSRRRGGMRNRSGLHLEQQRRGSRLASKSASFSPKDLYRVRRIHRPLTKS